jgi:hypothetical protein
MLRWSRVFRVLLIAAVLCSSFELSGLSALAGDPGCTEDCPSERSGECPPSCHTCSCCSFPRTAPAPATIADLPHPEGHTFQWAHSSDLPRSPDPADLLHVPKRARA